MRGAPLLFIGAVSHQVLFFFTVNTLIFSQKLSFVARYYLSFLVSLTLVASISFLLSLFNSLASCSFCLSFSSASIISMCYLARFYSLLFTSLCSCSPDCNGDLIQYFLSPSPCAFSLSFLPLYVIQLSHPHPVTYFLS